MTLPAQSWANSCTCCNSLTCYGRRMASGSQCVYTQMLVHLFAPVIWASINLATKGSIVHCCLPRCVGMPMSCLLCPDRLSSSVATASVHELHTPDCLRKPTTMQGHQWHPTSQLTSSLGTRALSTGANFCFLALDAKQQLQGDAMLAQQRMAG